VTATTTVDRARRLALAGQGLHAARPDTVDVRHLRRALRRNHVVQLDSVSVAARAHEMPFWSRLGAHDRARRDEWLWDGHENVELRAHEQCVVPVELWPLFAHDRRDEHDWAGVRRLRRDRPGYVEAVYEQVVERGPLTVADLDDGGGQRGEGMWGWSPGRTALAWLAHRGRVVQLRDEQFRITFDRAERVLPVEVLEAPEPTRREARRELLLLAARAHGIGTAHDLADHWRIGVTDARPVLDELAAEGALVPTRVTGLDDLWYRHPDIPMPREVTGARLLSPFDPLVWFRPRLERLWDFAYRIEIYVPRHKRRWGYYVLPFLLDGELVARVDLKADRDARVLRVAAAWVEDGHDPLRVARELAVELHRHAAWQDLTDVAVGPVGDLATALADAV
jgi:uncharacterized protein YcaQ